ncbi:MAG: glycosyltransferase, partial [Maribacter sp.]|nr:glycosyltransferase [Maribacter sp.]
MINKAIKRLRSDSEGLNISTIIFWLVITALFIRFPFFFRDYVDRDESTFILVAQSWVNGHLPYTQLWDVKPPLTFLYFASLIYIFGKSLFTIRLFGTILVIISSFFTYKIGVQIATKKIAFWAAIGSIVFQSLFGSLQGVMSEHITMAFFMPALYLLVRYRTISMVFIAGILMGISVMIKLNMAYAILFIGIYLLYDSFHKKAYSNGLLNAFTYGSGIIIIILFTMLPYYLNDIVLLWYKSVIKAPLDYTSARRYSILEMAPFLILISGFFIWIWKRKYIDFKDRSLQLLLVAIIGIVLSFVKGGRINGHYLIQLYPILLPLIVISLSRIPFLKKLKWKPYYLILIFLITMESYLEYVNVIKNKSEQGTFYNGEGISVPKYIMENQLETENILFLGYHIGYWVLGENPPTKSATHPSNILKDEMFVAYDNPRKTGLEEIRHIMETLRPKTVVIRKSRTVFDKNQIKANEYIDAYFLKHYQVHATVENAEILQR